MKYLQIICGSIVVLMAAGLIWLRFWLPKEAGAIGIIGGADGPTAIFTTTRLAPHVTGWVMAAVAVAAAAGLAVLSRKNRK